MGRLPLYLHKYLPAPQMSHLTYLGLLHTFLNAQEVPVPYVTPFFTPLRTFATHPTDALRDPTTAVFSTERGGGWHVYCSSMVCRGPGGGSCDAGPGRIRHFFASGTLEEGPTSGVFEDQGLVLEPRYNTSAWDAFGTFTPGIVRECQGDACTFYLFYGGVANSSAAHTESIGLAVGASPWGPFVRHGQGPVFSPWDAGAQWCHETSSPARVDEIKATIGGATPGEASGKPGTAAPSRALVVKAVCANFTALPVLYLPVNQSSWAPPYAVAAAAADAENGSGSPLFLASETCQGLGFEEPTLFESKDDGLLHFIAHNHGTCPEKYAHFVTQSKGTLANAQWYPASPFGSHSGAFMEPLPIPSAGDGVFGVGVGILPSWIDFGPSVDTDGLHFSNVSWNWTQPSV